MVHFIENNYIKNIQKLHFGVNEIIYQTRNALGTNMEQHIKLWHLTNTMSTRRQHRPTLDALLHHGANTEQYESTLM